VDRQVNIAEWFIDEGKYVLTIVESTLRWCGSI
jgi:flagellar biosynthesis/type III secretory pathway ATPase